MIAKANIPRWMIIVMDLALSLIGLFLAYLIRFDLNTDRFTIDLEWNILSKSIGFYIAVKLFVFYIFQIHKGLVRYTSSQDIKRIIIASLVTSGVFLVAGLFRKNFLDGFYLFPMSVLFVELFVSSVLILGVRFAVKSIYLESVKISGAKENILIYGSGEMGVITLNILKKGSESLGTVVGFLDDSKSKVGNRIEGNKVYHSSELLKIIKKLNVDTLIVAIQNPKKNLSNRVFDICIENNVVVKKVPSTKSWIDGAFTRNQIKTINIDDLLGRKSIQLDEEKIKSTLHNQVVLVTGAAGSIGSGLVRQIANYSPQKIVLLDQAESPCYDLQNELRSNFKELVFDVVIGDIRNRDRMENVFNTFNPKFVFHAAAYKHVPLMEDNPSEAILTNVNGTKNLVDLSIKYNIDKFVMVSTDKAVNPTNVMGASKRIAEIYAQSANEKTKTKIITTRFGNVLGSNGSVIPLFEKQIASGGPITVTDERITRFFMTIPEACQLVLEAGVMGEGGEIFVFDMGESVKIVDLAKKMIRLKGLELGKDIEIKFTGLRPGEKLYEELLAADENTLKTHHKQILKAKVRPASSESSVLIESLIKMFNEQDNNNIVQQMKKIVPEFVSNNSMFEKFDKK